MRMPPRKSPGQAIRADDWNALVDALPGQFMLPGHDGDVQVSFSAGVAKESAGAGLTRRGVTMITSSVSAR